MDVARWIVVLTLMCTFHSIRGCGILTHIEIGQCMRIPIKLLYTDRRTDVTPLHYAFR